MSTRKLPLRKIIGLYETLSQLDGHTEVVYDDGGKPQKGKTTPYKFGPNGEGGGKVRYAIVKNIAILKRYIDDYSKARDAMLVSLSDGSGMIKDSDQEKIAKFNVEVTKLLDQEEEVSGLLSIKIDDLNLEQNLLLPNSIVASLDPLLEG